MVDVTIGEPVDSLLTVKLQGETWELNIWASASDFGRLREIRSADWAARRSLAIGTSAGAPVYWATSDDQVTILIGHDDETWDIAVMVPLGAVDEIVSLVKRYE
ncbi:hypothetical protein [Actinoallomurus sp. CA-142502]|uniref:hypothetical protein n=1 Tax=Actinoallomurus sp. CA-142502 TaxID=3239885 RepID=UPI003D89BC67